MNSIAEAITYEQVVLVLLKCASLPTQLGCTRLKFDLEA